MKLQKAMKKPFAVLAIALVATLSISSVAYAAEYADGTWMNKTAGVLNYSSRSSIFVDSQAAQGIQSIKVTNAALPAGYGGVLGRTYNRNGAILGHTALLYNSVAYAFDAQYQVVAFVPNTDMKDVCSMGESYAYNSGTGKYEVFFPPRSPYVDGYDW